jgi:hypothetical protein
MRMMRIILLCILFSVALNALFAGYSFMFDPSGSGLNISVNRLEYSPFNSYFIPGLVLFTSIGLLSLITAIVTILKWKQYPWMIMIQGAVIFGWIVIQMAMLREVNYLHYIFMMIGVLLFFFGFRIKKLMKI